MLKHGADVNARDQRGDTALHVAAAYDYGQIVKLLLVNKADPNLRNEAGETPLDIVKQQARFLQYATPRRRLGVPRVFARLNPAPKLPRRRSLASLREHGALDNLPHMDRIEISRPSANFSKIIFRKGSNDWNHFTLVELIGVQYHFLAADPQGRTSFDAAYNGTMFFANYSRGNNGIDINLPSTLPFPDFQHVRLRRPAADLKSWKEQTLDFSSVFRTGNCSNVFLEWGDVVEIPEADHTLNDDWHGFSEVELNNLKQCLTRQTQVMVNGETKTLSLAPQITKKYRMGPGTEALDGYEISPLTPYWIRPALLQSKLLLASSDLSRVKVSRRDGNTNLQWVVDCGNATNAPDLWLRDGDVIEVPEKP